MKCKDCRWWETTNSKQPNEDFILGWCHRYPPINIVEEDGYYEHMKLVKDNNWCGEFGAKGINKEQNLYILNLSCRAERCLLSAGIKTIGELKARSKENLLRIRNFGMASYRETQTKLASIQEKP